VIAQAAKTLARVPIALGTFAKLLEKPAKPIARSPMGLGKSAKTIGKRPITPRANTFTVAIVRFVNNPLDPWNQTHGLKI
jgi:hypothetical protein